MPTQKMQREETERETHGPLAPLFICLFPPPGPALCKWGHPGMLFVPPEVLTPVLCSIFAGFSLPCLLAITILDSFSLF